MDTRFEIRPGRSINISIYRNPKSTQTAFLIHGIGGRGDQWREQINTLKSEYSLIIPDLLGHAKSDKPKPQANNPYAFDELEKDLSAIFKKFHSAENIVLGHSYGGALATALTLNNQDSINHLILISPTPCTPKLSIPPMYYLPTFIMQLARPWLEKKFQSLAYAPSTDKTLLAYESRASKNNQMYVIKALVQGMQKIPAIDVTMLTVPSLMISGAKDGIIPLNAQQQFYQALPHHQFNVIANAGHMPMLETPGEVNQLILAFLTKNAKMPEMIKS